MVIIMVGTADERSDWAEKCVYNMGVSAERLGSECCRVPRCFLANGRKEKKKEERKNLTSESHRGLCLDVCRSRY
jgi:hypothetical protein